MRKAAGGLWRGVRAGGCHVSVGGEQSKSTAGSGIWQLPSILARAVSTSLMRPPATPPPACSALQPGGGGGCSALPAAQGPCHLSSHVSSRRPSPARSCNLGSLPTVCEPGSASWPGGIQPGPRRAAQSTAAGLQLHIQACGSPTRQQQPMSLPSLSLPYPFSPLA